jgi:protein-tyrosine phosphatase
MKNGNSFFPISNRKPTGTYMLKRQTHLFLHLLFLPALSVFSLQAGQAPQAKRETAARDRQVKLEGQNNFRDLGGYRTSDGRTVKWGLIYRAGQLNRLTDADLSTLGSLKIRTVVDLRGPAEIERGKDRVPEGARDVSFPIDVNSLPKKEEPAPAKAGAPPDMMLQATQSIMLNKTDVYGSLVRELASPQNRPLVFHCTAGKDRTGIGAAIILTMLGVPWETVREDYLLSNVYRKEENEKELKNIRDGLAKKNGIPPEKVDMSPYEPMYYIKAEYIDAARQEVIAKYGSLENYFRKGLGISDEVIQRLRSELLE